MTDAWDEFNAQFTDPLPARRLNRRMSDGSVIGFSVPKGVTDSEALAGVIAMQEAVLRGHSRRMLMIDGPLDWSRLSVRTMKRVRTPLARFLASWIKWLALSAWTRIEAFAIRVWRATFARAETERAVAQMKRDLLGDDPATEALGKDSAQ